MTCRSSFLVPVLIAALLGGCCTKQINIHPAVTQCVGSVEPVAGLAPLPYQDDDLARVAVGVPGEGRLCTGKVLVVQKPVDVYRVWDRSKSFGKMGRWWTFDKPAGPLADWRAKYEVCPEWGARDVVSRCQLKVGAKVVVGPGQSMTCVDGIIPTSPANQVYIGNGLTDDQNLVENCEPDAAWP